MVYGLPGPEPKAGHAAIVYKYLPLRPSAAMVELVLACVISLAVPVIRLQVKLAQCFPTFTCLRWRIASKLSARDCCSAIFRNQRLCALNRLLKPIL
jgi:hypothetical protein